MKKIVKHKGCVVNIGDRGTLITFHRGNIIESEFFLESIDDAKKEYRKIFKGREKYPIYILLDESDQHYKNKTYPPIRQNDVKKLILRDTRKEHKSNGKKNIHGFLLEKNKKIDKWDVLYFSVNIAKSTDDWFDFFIGFPKNKIKGIYIYLLESYQFSKPLIDLSYQDLDGVKKSDINIITIDTKVYGIKQLIFNKDKPILSRNPDYDPGSQSFQKNFKQDIFRIVQYLKRLFPSLDVNNINFINVFSLDIIKKIEEIKNDSLKFTNYTPDIIVNKLEINSLIPADSDFSAMNISMNNFLNNKKKIFKHSLKRIRNIIIATNFSKILFLLNIGLILLIFILLFNFFLETNKISNQIDDLDQKELNLKAKLKSISEKAFGLQKETEQEKVYEIMDFAEIEKIFKDKENVHFNLLKKAPIIAKSEATVEIFNYSLKDFKYSNPKIKIRTTISGDLHVKSGDVDDLFNKFDNLIKNVKKEFSQYDLKYSDIPNNIDLSKKYYQYPFSLNIESK